LIALFHAYVGVSVRTGANFLISRALTDEVENWYQTLPHEIRFERYLELSDRPIECARPLVPAVDYNIGWLRAIYVSTTAVFTWPAVNAVATAPSLEMSEAHEASVRSHVFSLMQTIACHTTYLEGNLHPLVWGQVIAYLPLRVR
jgi:hypothetical protein